VILRWVRLRLGVQVLAGMVATAVVIQAWPTFVVWSGTPADAPLYLLGPGLVAMAACVGAPDPMSGLGLALGASGRRVWARWVWCALVVAIATGLAAWVDDVRTEPGLVVLTGVLVSVAFAASTAHIGLGFAVGFGWIAQAVSLGYEQEEAIGRYADSHALAVAAVATAAGLAYAVKVDHRPSEAAV
jgi:hypothetical protein